MNRAGVSKLKQIQVFSLFLATKPVRPTHDD